MEINSVKNQSDSIVNKQGKTSLHFNEFIYTWKIEHFVRLKYVNENVEIVSPKIVVFNCNTKYEFQLQMYYNYSSYDCCYNFRLNLKVLSCPTTPTKIHIEQSITTSNGSDYLKQIFVTVDKSSVIDVFTLKSGNTFNQCDSNGDLTIKCKFLFYNSYSLFESESSEFKAVRNQSTISILNEYEELFNSTKFSDVTLIVGDKQFLAHKAILASRNPVFSAMFKHEMLESKKNIVEVTDIDFQIMDEILRFIYANKIKSINNVTAHLLAAADKYQLESLRLMCEEVFIEKLNLDNVEEILTIVNRYETCHRLRDATFKFLSLNRKEVANWKNFDKVMKTLSPSLLFEIIKATMLKP